MNQEYKPEYEFTAETSEPIDEIKRTNYKIRECCLNCIFYLFRYGYVRHGWCALPSAHLRRKYSVAVDADPKYFPPIPKTSAWCHCEYHKYAPKSLNFGLTSKWTKLTVDKDGNLFKEGEEF